MAQKSQGIQQLLAAEKKAAEMVGEARKKKTRRLKQAKEEAVAEIEKFRSECEEKFKEKQSNVLGQDDFERQIKASTDEKMLIMSSQIDENKNAVIQRMIEMVNYIAPELHENFRV